MDKNTPQSSGRERKKGEKHRESVREREGERGGCSSMQTLQRRETVHSPKLVDTVAFQTVIKSE